MTGYIKAFKPELKIKDYEKKLSKEEVIMLLENV